MLTLEKFSHVDEKKIKKYISNIFLKNIFYLIFININISKTYLKEIVLIVHITLYG